MHQFDILRFVDMNIACFYNETSKDAADDRIIWSWLQIDNCAIYIQSSLNELTRKSRFLDYQEKKGDLKKTCIDFKLQL